MGGGKKVFIVLSKYQDGVFLGNSVVKINVGGHTDREMSIIQIDALIAIVPDTSLFVTNEEAQMALELNDDSKFVKEIKTDDGIYYE